MTYHIRPAREDDAAALIAIYAPYVTDTAITFEYEIPSCADFRSRIASITQKYPYLVAEAEGLVLGYAYASDFKARPAYNWSVETSIYLHWHYRGAGIGKALYCALEDRLRQQNFQNLNACITYPNSESISFHSRLGYQKVAHFTQCGFKHGAWHDVIWMQKCLGNHPVPPPAVLPPETRPLLDEN